MRGDKTFKEKLFISLTNFLKKCVSLEQQSKQFIIPTQQLYKIKFTFSLLWQLPLGRFWSNFQFHPMRALTNHRHWNSNLNNPKRLLRAFKVTRYWKSLQRLLQSLISSIEAIASLLGKPQINFWGFLPVIQWKSRIYTGELNIGD